MDHHRAIANYFNWKGVSVIFLFRRNLLRRLVSEMANAYDRNAKQLNGTHKSHVHSKEEVLSLALSLCDTHTHTCVLCHDLHLRAIYNGKNSLDINLFLERL